MFKKKKKNFAVNRAPSVFALANAADEKCSIRRHQYCMFFFFLSSLALRHCMRSLTAALWRCVFVYVRVCNKVFVRVCVPE